MVSEGQTVEYKDMKKNLHFEGEVVDVTGDEVVIQVDERYDVHRDDELDEELEVVKNNECLTVL